MSMTPQLHRRGGRDCKSWQFQLLKSWGGYPRGGFPGKSGSAESLLKVSAHKLTVPGKFGMQTNVVSKFTASQTVGLNWRHGPPGHARLEKRLGGRCHSLIFFSTGEMCKVPTTSRPAKSVQIPGEV
eukprot:3183428-Rhodomonas_salina.1